MSNNYVIREAKVEDIPSIQIVRNSVKENQLSNPLLVTDADCEEYITQRGRGWVATLDDQVVGFSIVDVKGKNVWALFLHPDHEKKGLGRKLHDLMMQWYFERSEEEIWLSTSPGTRAENFYREAGWIESGMHGKETKFTMSKDLFEKLR